MPEVPPTTTAVRPAREAVIRETPWLERKSRAEAHEPRAGGSVPGAKRVRDLTERRGAEIAAGVREVRRIGHVERVDAQLQSIPVVRLDALDPRRVEIYVAGAARAGVTRHVSERVRRGRGIDRDVEVLLAGADVAQHLLLAVQVGPLPVARCAEAGPAGADVDR